MNFETFFKLVYDILKRQSSEQQAHYTSILPEIVEFATRWYEVDASVGDTALKIIYKFDIKNTHK